MTKIDIFSGFLGAGKTTLIKKLIAEAYAGEKLVLIENEFGEIGIDGGFLQDAGVSITEMNSGCICCSLVGDFGKALQQVLDTYNPDRILIEPSGVGKLSDVIRAVQNLHSDSIQLESFSTVVDAAKCKMYQKNFGEFFNNQIEHANCIILSHTTGVSESKLEDCVKRIRQYNPTATIITTDWEQLSGKQILEAMTKKETLETALKELIEEHEHEHHHEDGETCSYGHHHDHNEHEHHHEDDETCSCGHHHEHDEHEHHHEDDETCSCGHHHEHGHHHADDVFTSWGVETTKKYTTEEITEALKQLENDSEYGMILRAKGIVPNVDGTWIHFDYVPGTPDVRSGSASTIGRLCVIGSNIKEDAIAKLFHAE